MLIFFVAEKKKCRKRQKHPHTWKHAVAKKAKQSGEEYVSKSGKLIPGKKPHLEKVLCSNSCRLKCSPNISAEQRKTIFHYYYDLHNEDLKTSYLFGCLIPEQPKTRLLSASRNREVTFKYYITVDGERKQICKTALCNLIKIGRGKVDAVQKQIKNGASCARMSLQGKHRNRPCKVDDEHLEFIRNHINSFPTETSHYSRTENPNREYLSPLISLAKMYKLYCDRCTEASMKPVSDTKYYQIFNTEFNLGFGSPKSDTCSKCDRIVQEQDNHYRIVAEHKERAKLAFDAQKEDRERATAGHCHVITFDLQKAMPLPKLSTSIAFYKRQLWLYNMGVHLTSKNGNSAFSTFGRKMRLAGVVMKLEVPWLHFCRQMTSKVNT